MKIRTRLILSVTLFVASGIVVASLFAVTSVRSQLFGQIDRTLIEQSNLLRSLPPQNFETPSDNQPVGSISSSSAPSARSPSPSPSLFQNNVTFTQLVRPNGSTTKPDFQTISLPKRSVSELRQLRKQEKLETITVNGKHIRMLSVVLASGYVVQNGRSLAEAETALNNLVIRLSLGALVGMVTALIVSIAIARRTVNPIQNLAAATEHITSTQDLSTTIDTRGNDELGRLTVSFNNMIAALRDSKDQQRMLIADASHELRTPVTVLRTNVELLARPELSMSERAEITKTITEEVDEFGKIVDEIMATANEGAADFEPKEVDLAQIAERCGDRLKRRAPALVLRTELQPTKINGDAQLLERAVSNILDNARKWSPGDGFIEMKVSDHRVEIRDHGVGIDEADLANVTRRFYRADSARSMPGSGLGLAIVKNIADLHGAVLNIENARDGGTVVTMTFPNTR